MREGTSWLYCNRTATKLEQGQAGQESGATDNSEYHLCKRIVGHSGTQQETPYLTYKEGVTGSNPASPALESAVWQDKSRYVENGRESLEPFWRHAATTALRAQI